MPRWLKRILDFFGPRPDPPLPPPPGKLTLRRRLSQPIIVPARGFVFTFQIHVMLTWYSDGLEEDLLEAWSQQFSGRARRELEQLASDLARQHYPHQAGDLEIRLNKELARERRRYERSGLALHCQPAVRVRLDDEVKEHLRPVYLERLKMEGEHELQMRRARMLDERTHRWIEVIGRLRRSSLAQAAAHLTDTQLADIIHRFVVEERTSSIELLASRLDDALRRSGRVGQPLEAHEAEEVIELLNEALSDLGAGTGNGRR